MKKLKSDYKMVQMDAELHRYLKDYCKHHGFSMAGVVAVNRDGNYAFPIRAIRIRVTAGTGTVRLAVIQAGIKQ